MCFQKYRYGMWLVWPAMLGVVDLGALFYQARPPPARPLRALYSSLVKASFGMCAVLVIMGCVLRVEG